MYKQRHDIRAFLEAVDAVAHVEINEAQGSTPRETGAWMLVSEASCLLYTSPSPRDQRGSRMPSSA